ncbi:nitroreductase family protein [Candidatus Nomurabacteria bacterium]|nr:nitroreductase family protein [Candidatus Nomurabacteria bacterium]
MELEEVIKKRYSEREYSDKVPDKELIEGILQSAWHAPNSCNMQVMQFLVISDEQIRNRMASVATAKFLWAPINILMMVDGRLTTKRHSAVMSLGAAMQNMLLTATDLGLAACPMAGFSNDDEIKSFFKIPDYFELILVLGIGYPKQIKGEDKPRERILLEESVHWNSFVKTKGLTNLSINANDWSISDLINYRRRISPVYRYKNHFSLGIYAPNIFKELVGAIKENIPLNGQGMEILDVNTYDGIFIKEFIDQIDKTAKITTSDYLDYILGVIDDFGRKVETVKISQANIFGTNKLFDLVTIIHRLQFMPHYETLLKESAGLVKSGGYMVVAVDNQSSLVWFLRKTFIKFKCFLKKETFNVYENNPYYKIGPYSVVSHKFIKSKLNQLGFNLVTSGKISSENRKASNQTYYAIFKKQ